VGQNYLSLIFLCYFRAQKIPLHIYFGIIITKLSTLAPEWQFTQSPVCTLILDLPYRPLGPSMQVKDKAIFTLIQNAWSFQIGSLLWSCILFFFLL